MKPSVKKSPLAASLSSSAAAVISPGRKKATYNISASPAARLPVTATNINKTPLGKTLSLPIFINATTITARQSLKQLLAKKSTVQGIRFGSVSGGSDSVTVGETTEDVDAKEIGSASRSMTTRWRAMRPTSMLARLSSSLSPASKPRNSRKPFTRWRRPNPETLAFRINLIKYVLIVVNSMLLIGGTLDVGLGKLMVNDETSFLQLAYRINLWGIDTRSGASHRLQEAHEFIHEEGMTLIISGIADVVVAFIGWCGAARLHRKLLILYVLGLAILITLEVSTCAYVVLHQAAFSQSLEYALHDTLKIAYMTAENEMWPIGLETSTTKSWDNLMQTFKCCGVHSWRDFNTSSFASLGVMASTLVPTSCCIHDYDPSQLGVATVHFGGSSTTSAPGGNAQNSAQQNQLLPGAAGSATSTAKSKAMRTTSKKQAKQNSIPRLIANIHSLNAYELHTRNGTNKTASAVAAELRSRFAKQRQQQQQQRAAEAAAAAAAAAAAVSAATLSLNIDNPQSIAENDALTLTGSSTNTEYTAILPPSPALNAWPPLPPVSPPTAAAQRQSVLTGLVQARKPRLLDRYCPVRPTQANSYMSNGCYEALWKWLVGIIQVFTAITIVFCVLQTAALVFGAWLYVMTGQQDAYRQQQQVDLVTQAHAQEQCQLEQLDVLRIACIGLATRSDPNLESTPGSNSEPELTPTLASNSTAAARAAASINKQRRRRRHRSSAAFGSNRNFQPFPTSSTQSTVNAGLQLTASTSSSSQTQTSSTTSCTPPPPLPGRASKLHFDVMRKPPVPQFVTTSNSTAVLPTLQPTAAAFTKHAISSATHQPLYIRPPDLPAEHAQQSYAVVHAVHTTAEVNRLCASPNSAAGGTGRERYKHHFKSNDGDDHSEVEGELTITSTQSISPSSEGLDHRIVYTQCQHPPHQLMDAQPTSLIPTFSSNQLQTLGVFGGKYYCSI